jgi:hypothetical protein
LRLQRSALEDGEGEDEVTWPARHFTIDSRFNFGVAAE